MRMMPAERKMPVVLHLGHNEREEKHMRKLEGVRRFARASGWNVEAVPREYCSRESIGGMLARFRPMGCVIESSDGFDDYPRRLFGRIPAIYLDPSVPPRGGGARFVVNDDAEIARSAYRELQSGLPPSFAVVTYRYVRQWARERTEVFRSLCVAAGRECAVFPDRAGCEDPPARAARLARWVAALPAHCAIFAVNDYTAHETAIALAACGRAMPRSATLVGVDGQTADFGDSLADRISSIRIDFERAGFLAASLLADGGTSAMFGPLMVLRRESTRGRGRRDPHVMEAVKSIRREACDGLTAAALAARVPGSRKHFERRFREAMGHSVLDEILHVRLEQVQTFLSCQDVAIDAIAGLSGFGSEIELRRLFRRRFGMSMKEWRARHVH